MKVYPDNNVLVDIEGGKYSVEMFMSISDVVYYYSDAHMNELLEAKGNPKVSQKGRLGLISKLCGCNNIFTGLCDVPEFYEKEPLEMYEGQGTGTEVNPQSWTQLLLFICEEEH